MNAREPAPPSASWTGRVRARLRALLWRRRRGIDQESLLSFAPEEAPPARRRRRRSPAVAATLAVVLVAFAYGVAVAIWLEWQPQAAPRVDGTLTITSEPSGAAVFVDGVRAGVTPTSVSLRPGEHRVELGEGDVRRSRTITMRAGDGFVHFDGVQRQLERLGELHIRTDPVGLQVRLDGQPRGVAPLIVKVPAGSHVITVSAPGTAVTRQVVVQAGAVTTVVMSPGNPVARDR